MNTTIKNTQGEKLDYALHGDPSDLRRIVLIGHGVTGNKDRPWAIALAEALAAVGVNALRFSFSGNGESEGDFRESTISKEVADLGAVIDTVQEAGYGEIIFVGHSMGGAVGVIRAAKDSRIDKLVSLAGMVHTAKFAETEFADQVPDQGLMWDEEGYPLSAAFIDDLNEIDSVLHLGAHIQIPWLLVHGTEDDVIPIAGSREIFSTTCGGDPAQNRKLIELPGANHVFAEDGQQAMIDVVVGWVRKP